MVKAIERADLTEARRLLGSGMKLVELIPYTKRPAGNDWNHRPVTSIDPNATGYGLLLADNKLCSIDPDNYLQAKVGMRALGFDLDAFLDMGVRTRSTRPGSGGRSTFASEGDLSWLTFRSRAGTALEFRAESPNLQDCIPGVVYRDIHGRMCRQEYSNCKRLDDAPPLPDELLLWWQLCSKDIEFLRAQERLFFDAIGIEPYQSISTGKGLSLAFPAPGFRTAFNAQHRVEDLLDRHGYKYDRESGRWACPSASGAPGIRPIPHKQDLWRSDHASDPLMGTFDAWTAYVVLEHGGDIESAKQASRAAGVVVDMTGFFDGIGSRKLPAKTLSLQHDAAIVATPFTWRDPATIPPRPWIYGFHYMRGMVSSTAGAGGAGKSTLVIAELLSMVTGKDLLRGGQPLIVGPQRVWYHNGEDPKDELDRRFGAAMIHYGLTLDDIGDRLYITSGRDTPIIVATDVAKTTMIQLPVRDALVEAIKQNKIDILSVDPFISTHNVGENDNTAMEQVMRVWRDVAEQTRAAIDLTHHFRKASGGEVSADELRGASAITGACRSVRVVAAMSTEEATKAAIDPDERLRFLWCANPKGNMTIASTRKHWRYLESVSLDNAADPYPADSVGVATEWHYPETRASDLNPIDINLIRHKLRMADAVTRCRVAPQSKHWAGFLVAEVLELDMDAPSTRNQVITAIACLAKMGAIKKAEARDNAKRRTVPVWEPGDELT